MEYGVYRGFLLRSLYPLLSPIITSSTPEGRVRNEGTGLIQEILFLPPPQSLLLFIISLQNFTFFPAACGSKERRTNNRSLSTLYQFS